MSVVLAVGLMPLPAFATTGALVPTQGLNVLDAGGDADDPEGTGDLGGDDDPSGDDPSGDDPSGDDPSGDDPSGDDPSGDDPSGDDPSGDDPSGDDPSGDDPSGDDPNDNNDSSNASTISLGDTGVSVASGGSLAFTAPETGAYRLSIDSVPDNEKPRVFFNKYVNAENETWRTIECCDLRQNDEGFDGDYYYAFYAEKGQSYQFVIQLFNEGQPPVSVSLEVSTLAGLTDEGILWRAGNDLVSDGGEAAIVLGIDETSANVVIPSTVGSFPVVATERQALCSNAMETLVISEGVKWLGQYACSDNPKLRSVSFPSTLESTGGGNPFEHCENLTIEFPNGSDFFKVEDSCLIGLGDGSLQLVSYLGSSDITEFHVPDGITDIDWRVFSGTALTKLYCPESVSYVSRQDAENLIELHLANGHCDFDDLALATQYDSESEKTVYKAGATVYAPAGGKAEHHCSKLGIRFVAEGEVQLCYDIGEYLMRGAYGAYIEDIFEPDGPESPSEMSTLMQPSSGGLYCGKFTPSKDGMYWILSQVAVSSEDRYGSLDVESLTDSEGRQIQREDGERCAFKLAACETYTFTAELVGGEGQDDYADEEVWCCASWRGENGVWPLEGTQFHVSQKSLVYTGAAIVPDVYIFSSGAYLPETAYDLEFRNNVNAGMATMVLKGKGEFSGTATGTFVIAPASLSGATVNVAAQTYTGSALTPAPVVKLGGKTLAAGTDYTVAYANNVAVGQASAVITGKGNYTGSVTARFNIDAPPATAVDVAVGATAKASDGATYKVTSSKAGAEATVTYQAPAKSKKSVKVPAKVVLNGKTYQVTGIAKGAFKKSKAKTVTIASKKLTKKGVKGCFKGSKVKTVKVPKSKLKAYKKIFTKKNCGAKVKVVAK